MAQASIASHLNFSNNCLSVFVLAPKSKSNIIPVGSIIPQSPNFICFFWCRAKQETRLSLVCTQPAWNLTSVPSNCMPAVSTLVSLPPDKHTRYPDLPPHSTLKSARTPSHSKALCLDTRMTLISRFLAQCHLCSHLFLISPFKMGL